MRILGWFTMTAIAAATAFGGEERPVTVCMDPSADGREIRAAQSLASKMFARIHVEIDWRELRSCPAGRDALQISLSDHTPEHQLPGALAYALPYEGSRIVVFYDRVRKSDPDRLACSLAYVLVHEVTHILEGITRHSKCGIMKAQWDRNDHFEIGLGRLGFAPEDVNLIYRGLAARVARQASSTLGALAIAPPPIPGRLAAE
jgi:hypothetical protein